MRRGAHLRGAASPPKPSLMVPPPLSSTTTGCCIAAHCAAGRPTPVELRLWRFRSAGAHPRPPVRWWPQQAGVGCCTGRQVVMEMACRSDRSELGQLGCPHRQTLNAPDAVHVQHQKRRRARAAGRQQRARRQDGAYGVDICGPKPGPPRSSGGELDPHRASPGRAAWRESRVSPCASAPLRRFGLVACQALRLPSCCAQPPKRHLRRSRFVATDRTTDGNRTTDVLAVAQSLMLLSGPPLLTRTAWARAYRRHHAADPAPACSLCLHPMGGGKVAPGGGFDGVSTDPGCKAAVASYFSTVRRPGGWGPWVRGVGMGDGGPQGRAAREGPREEPMPGARVRVQAVRATHAYGHACTAVHTHTRSRGRTTAAARRWAPHARAGTRTRTQACTHAHIRTRAFAVGVILGRRPGGGRRDAGGLQGVRRSHAPHAAAPGRV
jgi:hypothetical protein